MRLGIFSNSDYSAEAAPLADDLDKGRRQNGPALKQIEEGGMTMMHRLAVDPAAVLS